MSDDREPVNAGSLYDCCKPILRERQLLYLTVFFQMIHAGEKDVRKERYPVLDMHPDIVYNINIILHSGQIVSAANFAEQKVIRQETDGRYCEKGDSAGNHREFGEQVWSG